MRRLWQRTQWQHLAESEEETEVEQERTTMPGDQHGDESVDVPVTKQRHVPTLQVVQKTVEVPQMEYVDHHAQETMSQTYMDEQQGRVQSILPSEFVKRMNQVKSNFGLLSKQIAFIRQSVEEGTSTSRSSSRSSSRPPSPRWSSKEVADGLRLALAGCVKYAEFQALKDRTEFLLERSAASAAKLVENLEESLAVLSLLTAQRDEARRQLVGSTAEAQRLLHRAASLAVGNIVEFVGLSTNMLSGTCGEITEFAVNASQFVARTDLGTKHVKPESLKLLSDDGTDTEEEAGP